MTVVSVQAARYERTIQICYDNYLSQEAGDRPSVSADMRLRVLTESKGSYDAAMGMLSEDHYSKMKSMVKSESFSATKGGLGPLHFFRLIRNLLTHNRQAFLRWWEKSALDPGFFLCWACRLLGIDFVSHIGL